jgi:UDP-N-acetylglucosamine 2-epimerase (non-hydrolysing)
LVSEGVPRARIVFVGNAMIDSLHWARQRPTDAVERFGLRTGDYALATLHRPSNVDTRDSLVATLDALAAISARLPVLFPVHPRTVARAESLRLADRLRSTPGLLPTGPLGYNDFITLMTRAKLVATDSGGIQEETTALAIPCLTLRNGTERPITVTQGTNVIVGLDADKIVREVDAIMSGHGKVGGVVEGWDGHAAERIADAIQRLLAGVPPPLTSGARA